MNFADSAMSAEKHDAVSKLLDDTNAGYLLWHESTRRRQGYTAERVGEYFFLDACGRFLEIHDDEQSSPHIIPGKGLLPLLEEVEEQCQKRDIRDRLADNAWEKTGKKRKQHSPHSRLSYPAPIEAGDEEEWE